MFFQVFVVWAYMQTPIYMAKLSVVYKLVTMGISPKLFMPTMKFIDTRTHPCLLAMNF